jgi:hypothetical protein
MNGLEMLTTLIDSQVMGKTVVVKPAQAKRSLVATLKGRLQKAKT